jgi:small subunit ribosomal protein S20
MAHSVSARKRVRQNESHRARNRWRKQAMRKSIKDFLGLVSAGKIDEAKASFPGVQKIIDRTARQGVIKKNHAARRKSRLNAVLKAKANG